MPRPRRNRPDPFSPDDQHLMRRAIALARRGEGRVEPNPMVGCVLVKKGRIIGEGYHRKFGGPHAEIEALRASTENPRGGTAYVSLEPCSHHGKTPPCVEALIEAQLARVVVALADPHSQVNGRGIRRLRRAGIRVEVGLGKEQAAEILAPFATRCRLDRPYVIAKWAQSLDGKLATATGCSQWISGEASRRRVHKLRGRVDAILVGAGTVATDDPLLTARGIRPKRIATRVVLDGRLRVSEKAQLVATAGEAPTLIFTSSEKANSIKARRLRKRGVEVTAAKTRKGRLVLTDCLTKLALRDVTNLLVEGGPTVLTSFFEQGLVDEALVFTAPRLIGGSSAASAILGNGALHVEDALAPRTHCIHKVGQDILHHLRFRDPVALLGRQA